MADLNWKVGDIVSNARGTKTASILSNGQCPTKKFGTVAHPLRAPYGANSFDPNSTRLNIDFCIDVDLREFLGKVDKWAKETILKESPRFFKKQLTKDEVNLMYVPTIKKHNKDGVEYADTCKTKFTKNKLRHWGFDHKAREAPSDYRNADLVGMVAIKNLWFGSNQFGVVLELEDLIVSETIKECPF